MTPPIDPHHNPALEGSPLVGYLKFAVPSVVGLVVLSAAPIIDGLFIANYVGVEALAAVNLIIPFYAVVFGMAYMVAIGGSVTAGKYIGEDNKQGANDIFSKAVIFLLLYSLVILVGGVFASEFLFSALGAGPNLYPLMGEYFGTLVWFFPIQILGVTYYYYVRISGFPALVSVAIVLGVVTNLALNYLLIAVLQWGLQGAAVATGISATVMLVVTLAYKLSEKAWLKLAFVQSNWKELAFAAYNGFSDLIDEISGGVVALILNLIIIASFGDLGIAAFSVVSYSLVVGFLFFFGLSEALQAVCSQCFGAQDVRRLKQFLRVTLGTMTVFAAIFSASLLLFGDVFIGFFIDAGERNLVQMSNDFIAILWPIFVFNGFNVTVAAYLTSVHQPTASAGLAVVRALIFPLGLLYIITEYFPEIPFLFAIVVGEILAAGIAFALLVNYRPSRVLAKARF